MLAVNERGGAAAVQVDRLLRPERDHQARELRQVESAVDARAAPVAAHGEDLAIVDAERAARVATDRDVRVELRRARREALSVLAVDDRVSAGDEQPAGLEPIALGGVGTLAA